VQLLLKLPYTYSLFTSCARLASRCQDIFTRLVILSAHSPLFAFLLGPQVGRTYGTLSASARSIPGCGRECLEFLRAP
jgi:hypothetical protein